MKNLTTYKIFLTCFLLLCSLNITSMANERLDLSEQMKDSIVYLSISTSGYHTREPWSQKNLSQNWASACAVGPYQVVTTADKVADAAFIKVLRYGQNEFVNAELKVVDYQANLCLIELDKNQLKKPLTPLNFAQDYQKGASVDSYWLTSANRIVTKRGYLDHVGIEKVETSYGNHLRYIIADASQRTSSGELYCAGSSPIGIACRSNMDDVSYLIPAETIIKFLKVVDDGNYEGFGSVGFAVTQLLDPAMRSYLKMPESLINGVYVADVYTLGTGSDVLENGDVLLGIDDNEIDSYGLFVHPKYDQLELDYLITSKNAGQTLKFVIWRDGEKKEITAEIKNFKESDMLIPYHEFDKQPEYIIVAGFVFQKLTRDYLLEFGNDLAGDAPSELYYYYREFAFKPDEKRKDIVTLSFTLPNEFNVGYTSLGHMIVSTYNGMKISSIEDIFAAQKLNPDSPYDIIEFEMDNPTLVIARNQIQAANSFITATYGVRKLANINN